jgi:hypothetical protein
VRPSIFSDAEAIEALVSSEDAAPLPEELEAVRAAVRIADARLSLPDKITVLWRSHSSADAALGACKGMTIYFALGSHLGLELLGRTALHELQHCADFHAGLRCSRDESERRADLFAETYLPYWRARALPPAPSALKTAPPTPKTVPRPRRTVWSREVAVASLTLQVKVRVSRLQRCVDPVGRRDLGAIAGLVEQLAYFARRAKT